MGCDIHISIQVKEQDGPFAGVWSSLTWQSEPWGDHRPVDGFPVAPKCFDGRNYDLFGILANVRNGVGFAGVMRGAPWPPIAPGRGFPKGFDADSQPGDPADAEKYPDEGSLRWMGDHSFTWVSLDELRGYDWDGTTHVACGYVQAEEYEKLDHGNEEPASYCGGVGGPGVGLYEPAEYEAEKEAGTLPARPYVRAYWTISAREATGDWPGKCIPWLEGLAAGRPLRLVMGFDS